MLSRKKCYILGNILEIWQKKAKTTTFLVISSELGILSAMSYVFCIVGSVLGISQDMAKIATFLAISWEFGKKYGKIAAFLALS